MWFQGGQHMVSKVDTMWFPQDTTWFLHGCHVVSIWTPSAVEVTTWKPVQKTALHEANWLPCYSCYLINATELLANSGPPLALATPTVSLQSVGRDKHFIEWLS